MEFDDMDHMPDWDYFTRHRLNDAEDKNQFSLNTEKDRLKVVRAKALYNQARAVYKYAALFCETLKGEMAELTSSLIMQNALMLCPKIVGAEGADLYSLRMENASIIRTNCREMETQVKAAELFEICNPEYKEIVLAEINKFRLLFIEWVKHFEKDEFEDDWGLF
ncbi:hypothetical protein ACFOG5_16850 [Pedobacter fastidiosus]|uniref:HEPN domain-containing protein n=1 Tax=Pedobacter fastidiosus TaxID=2765361 RepID=A0ABR7KSM2_9SPHI|nr:hypothetical protein [Pedobacter fastidiosus]MBC6110738.1 hypothetical protein [Pedobacter fastidiosus]